MSSLDQRLIAGNVPKIRKAGQVVATLDLGATKIACLIVRTTDPSQGGFELLGYGQQSSRGLKNGTVIDVFSFHIVEGPFPSIQYQVRVYL